MRSRWLVLLVVVAGSTIAAPALADEPPLDGTGDDVSNKGQFGVHAKLGTGYRGIFRYNDEYCGKTGEDLCLGRAPFALDLGLSYRATNRLEILIEMRVGLESDFGTNDATDGNRIFAISPGVKLYFREAGTAKFFSTLQFVIDTTNYPQADKTDLGVKNTSGLQLDLHKTMGVFFFFGEQVGWSRWLRLELEGGMGIQARFP